MSWYRRAVWFAKGLREYTRSGYESASKRFGPADVEVDVAGKSFLVTGANSGIGKATAKGIAKRGGTVHMVCRNKERAEEAKAEIMTETGNQSIFLHILDISNPKEIWKFAEKFKNEHKLNVLINNAGCMVNQRELTEDGLEKNFATNTLDVQELLLGLGHLGCDGGVLAGHKSETAHCCLNHTFGMELSQCLGSSARARRNPVHGGDRLHTYSPHSVFCCLLLSELLNLSCWTPLRHSKYSCSQRSVVYHLPAKRYFFSPLRQWSQTFRLGRQYTFQWQAKVIYNSLASVTRSDLIASGSTAVHPRAPSRFTPSFLPAGSEVTVGKREAAA
ncbi:dehydrogenase/reductase SDR family member 12 isoform X2 [Dromaius novaehollandiae]|uniref:dehydrogenase/reductase SDR family member 12 isoform X2 n=1 Tax=Dromaius novaehollandiae TaxID=8790 RepID=UPI00311E6823